jgi:hypothetical protein
MDHLERLSNGAIKKNQWVRCVTHIINLAVQAFLVEMKATASEFRDYMKATKKNALLSNSEEVSFLKVINH